MNFTAQALLPTKSVRSVGGAHTMRVTSTFRFVPERNFPWLTLSLPPVAEYCTVLAVALADVSAFDARVVVALARVPASLAVQP